MPEINLQKHQHSEKRIKIRSKEMKAGEEFFTCSAFTSCSKWVQRPVLPEALRCSELLLEDVDVSCEASSRDLGFEFLRPRFGDISSSSNFKVFSIFDLSSNIVLPEASPNKRSAASPDFSAESCTLDTFVCNQSKQSHKFPWNLERHNYNIVESDRWYR